jgi:pyridoxal 5'-phosphate synthase pdxS subunit
MQLEELRFGTELLKRGFAKMQKGGVIMDVTTPEQAVIAEDAGAVAVMALQAVPADIRKMGGVARMADPKIIMEIIDAVTIPVMAMVRIGHFAEAQILEALGVDMIDESEVLTNQPMIPRRQVKFSVTFVGGARNWGGPEGSRRGGHGLDQGGRLGPADVTGAVRFMRLSGAHQVPKGMADRSSRRSHGISSGF